MVFKRPWISQDIGPGVGLLGHIIALLLVFLRNLHIVLHSGSIYLHSHQQWRGSPFLYTLSTNLLQHLLFADIFDDGHSDQCGVIPHCSFDLHFSNSDVEHLFICLLAIYQNSNESSKGRWADFKLFILSLNWYWALGQVQRQSQ